MAIDDQVRWTLRDTLKSSTDFASRHASIAEQAQLAIVRRGVQLERDQAITLGQRRLRAHHQRDDGEAAGGDRDTDRPASTLTRLRPGY